MIALLVEAATPRINYTAKFIFQTHFKVPYQVVLYRPDTPLPDACLVNYTQWDIPDAINIRPSGLLSVSDWQPFALPVQDIRNIIATFGREPEANADWPTEIDFLACIFWALTEYERYSPHFPKDRYGRYDESHYLLIQSGLFAHAWIEIWLKQLQNKLQNKQPRMPFQLLQWSWSVGVDFDQPFKYRHKPFYVQAGACLRDGFKGKLSVVLERLAVLAHYKKDPFATADAFLALVPRENLRVFFLLDSQHPHDNRFYSTQKAIQQLISQFLSRNVPIGLHPGYLSSAQPALMQRQMEGLTSVLNQPITASRQHFLRYQLPSTYRQLIEVGIRDEFTGGFYGQIGYKYGYSQPFYWFDLLNNQETELQIHPSIIMDRTMLSYLHLTVDQAIEETLRLLYHAQSLGGHFGIFTHNDTLSNDGEWLGWRRWLQEIVGRMA
jgi:hypothetical protein